jgi:Mlc titration factor MtfA (ptsG expression regulator)
MDERMFDRLKHWLGASPEAPPAGVPEVPELLWRRVERTLPWLAALPAPARQRLHALVPAFLASKQFHGADGMALSDEIMLSIAIQACLPILRTGIDSYRDWVGIVVYPGEFVVDREFHDEDGIVHSGPSTLLGEAWDGGPVVVSWADDAQPDGVNVLIHEFAHTLDMANGGADGFPPLPADMDRAAWARAFSDAYDDLCERVDFDQPTALDPYASEHPAEFFAVASEVFFEDPPRLHAAYPEVFAQLARLYGVDTLTGQLTASMP